MIVAYCDHCGEKCPADEQSGCRIVLGKRELSWHLCPQHRDEIEQIVLEFLAANGARLVRS